MRPGKSLLELHMLRGLPSAKGAHTGLRNLPSAKRAHTGLLWLVWKTLICETGFRFLPDSVIDASMLCGRLLRKRVKL